MHTYFTTFSVHTLRRAGVVLGCMAIAFGIGIQTAGDWNPIVEPTRAGIRLSGDIDGDGLVTAMDAQIALEIARGLREPTALELEGDPNQDYRITIDDVAVILHSADNR